MFARCKQGTDLLYHHANLGGGRISRTAREQISSMVFVFVFYCSSRFQITKFVKAISS